MKNNNNEMLHLHFYSNHAGRLVLNKNLCDWWSFETYPLESIKEFEQISQAWKSFLSNSLAKGLFLFSSLVLRNICTRNNINDKFSVFFFSSRRR